MLILPLPLHPGSATGTGTSSVAFVHSLDGTTVLRSGQAALAGLAAMDGQVVAVVPWQRLSWHAVTLPPQSGGRQTAVLHGLLEEQLLEDPAALHLAVAPNTSTRRGGDTLVAVCSRHWLQQALAPLEAVGLRVQRIVPECSPIHPVQAEPWLQLVEHDGQTLGLLRHAQGVTPIPHNTRSAWSASLNAVSACWAEPATIQQASDWCAQEALLQPAAHRWLQAARGDWDLAQGEWSQSHAQRSGRWLHGAWNTLRHDPAWRAVRWGAGLLLLAQVVGLNAWAWRDQSQLKVQEQQLQQLLTDTFPQVRVVVDPALQMRREVDALRQATGAPSPQDADHLLSRLSEVLPPQASPRQLGYAAGELRWQVNGPGDIDAAVQQRLQAQGYRLSRQGDEQALRWEGTR
jgi:general secretion pathway protein L